MTEPSRQKELTWIQEFEAAFAQLSGVETTLALEETLTSDVSDEELSRFGISPDEINEDHRVYFAEELIWRNGRVLFALVWDLLREDDSDVRLGAIEYTSDACLQGMLTKMADNVRYLGNGILHEAEAKTADLRKWTEMGTTPTGPTAAQNTPSFVFNQDGGPQRNGPL